MSRALHVGLLRDPVEEVVEDFVFLSDPRCRDEEIPEMSHSQNDVKHMYPPSKANMTMIRPYDVKSIFRYDKKEGERMRYRGTSASGRAVFYETGSTIRPV